MLRQQNFYHVTPFYLTPPGAMVLACLLFMVLVWKKTRHDYVWKTSSLPLLFLTLNEQLDYKGVRSIEEMDQLTARTRVKLIDTAEDVLKLVEDK